MKYSIIIILTLIATQVFAQKKGNEDKNAAKTDSVAQVVDTPKTNADSTIVAADTVSAKVDSIGKAATTVKTDTVAKPVAPTTATTTTVAPAAKQDTESKTSGVQLDSLAKLNTLLTAKFNTVNAELEKYRGVYTVIKEKVLNRDFDPEKFAQIVDSLAANRDSTALGMAAVSGALRDSLLNFKNEITELKAKLEAATTAEVAKQRLVNELKTLKELLDAKILTQTEFDIKKAAVLRKWD